jgi:hypothetical protein
MFHVKHSVPDFTSSLGRHNDYRQRAYDGLSFRAKGGIVDLQITYELGADGVRHLRMPEEVKVFVRNFVAEHAAKAPAEIAAVVQAGHDPIARQLEGLSDEQARFKPAPDQWSVLELMQHVVTVKQVCAGLCTSLGSGQMPAGFGPEWLEEKAQDGVTVVRFETVAEARDAVEKAHKACLAVIEKLDAAQLDVTFSHFVFGPMNARQWAVFGRVHDEDHGPQLARILASPGFPAV